MKKYGIECGDDITGILPLKPYEKPLAKSFLMAVKLDNLKEAYNFLQVDKFLVHQFDDVILPYLISF